MPLLLFTLAQSAANHESALRSVKIPPRLCSAMVLTMNAYKGRFKLEHLSKVRAAHGLNAFDGQLREFVEAVLCEGSVEVAFAPRYAKSSESKAQPPTADE